MRLWSLHPRYLDAKGLVALWREALLAQKVLQAKTQGYRHHPQLIRFKSHPRPLAAIACYLMAVWQEAQRRSYRFNKGKIAAPGIRGDTQQITVTQGQLDFERDWLLSKLKKRDPERYHELSAVKRLASHPIFKAVRGPVAEWEKIRTG